MCLGDTEFSGADGVILCAADSHILNNSGEDTSNLKKMPQMNNFYINIRVNKNY